MRDAEGIFNWRLGPGDRLKPCRATRGAKGDAGAAGAAEALKQRNKMDDL
jgi:hypothetical protein